MSADYIDEEVAVKSYPTCCFVASNCGSPLSEPFNLQGHWTVRCETHKHNKYILVCGRGWQGTKRGLPDLLKRMGEDEGGYLGNGSMLATMADTGWQALPYCKTNGSLTAGYMPLTQRHFLSGFSSQRRPMSFRRQQDRQKF